MIKFRKIMAAILASALTFGSAYVMPVNAVVNQDKAVTIDTNKAKEGNLSSKVDHRDYKVVLPADGYVYVSFSHDFVNQTHEFWKVILEDKDGNIYFDKNFVGNTESVFDSVKYGLAKGTYYLRVSSINVSEAKYNLKVNYKPIDDWEKEMNGSFENANQISYNKYVNGNIFDNTDKDFYKISLPAAGYINIMFDHDKVTSSSNLWETYIYDKDGNNLNNGNYYDTYAGNVTDTVTGSNVGVSAGDYFIMVKNSGLGSDANYKFIVTYDTTSAWEQESNNSIADANEVTISEDKIGKVSFKDYDYYKVSVNEAMGVKLLFKHQNIDKIGSYIVTVMDEKENLIGTKQLSDFNRADTLTYDFELPAGASYICVTTSVHDTAISNLEYSLTLNPLDCCWITAGKAKYWYEKGLRQGTVNDKAGVMGDGTIRGREIYDKVSDGWYWLDSVYNGAKAVNKEVWMPYIYQDEATISNLDMRQRATESIGMSAYVYECMLNHTGKWVRYDADGKMIKGWFSVDTPELRKLYPEQAGMTYYYDPKTGIMAKGKVTIDNIEHEFHPVTGQLLK